MICKKCQVNEINNYPFLGLCNPCYKKEWRQKTKKERLEYNKEWRKKNPDKLQEQYSRFRKKNPLKYLARRRANHYSFRRPFCLLHLLWGEKVKGKEFHHTDYEYNLGFTVCKECHIKADNWLKSEGVET